MIPIFMCAPFARTGLNELDWQTEHQLHGPYLTIQRYPDSRLILAFIPSQARPHEADQLSSISAAARLPTFLSITSRPLSSFGLSSENTLFICPECFRKAEAMRSLPRGVRATIRTRRSSLLSTRLTRPLATRRSTAVLIEPGVRSTIGPIVLTGKGPL